VDPFVPEHAIDYDEVFSRGGRNFGDEDFAVFRCPGCGKVYLIDHEVDIVFTNGRDLTARVPISDPGFACVACGSAMPEHPLGRRMAERTRVTWDQLRDSDWAWAATIEVMLRNQKRMKREAGLNT
jgi:hypothetical protein